MQPWIERLKALRAKKSRVVIGLMSGTSADGIDAAVLRVASHGSSIGLRLLSFCTQRYRADIRSAIARAAMLTPGDLAELDLQIAESFAAAARAALKRAALKLAQVDLIGSHGQTVYHHSGLPARRSTLQVGDGDIIAVQLGVPVVSDFRRKDVALGGQGAPITPYADQILFGAAKKSQAILNLGGIANLTILDRRGKVQAGFDCGPANAPLDRVAQFISAGRKRYDHNGRLAAGGKVLPKLLEALIRRDHMLKKRGPKSSGLETYGDEFVRTLAKLNHGKLNADVLRTLCSFIAEGVARALKPYRGVERVVVAGGGARNRTLMKVLRERLTPLSVVNADELGISADAREAISFAILANDFLWGEKTSLPQVTGAQKASILGKLSLPW